jgi:hypothetical protein
MATDVHTMALTYVHAGWSVFPLWWVDGRQCACPLGVACESPGKHPVPKLGSAWLAPKGVKEASDDPAVINRWWSAAPFANIGLPAHANGLAIVDVDPRHGGTRSLIRLRVAMVDRGVLWPATIVQRTGSDGEHHLFAAPEGGITSKKLAFGPELTGLDTRGRGGYIVAAPSLHASGDRYQWKGAGYGRRSFLDELPPWPPLLTQLMDPTRAALRAVGVQFGASPAQVAKVAAAWPDRIEGYVAKAVADELDRLTRCAAGGRNHQLNKSAYALGRFVMTGHLDERTVYRELCQAAVASGLNGEEITKSVLSGLAAGKARTNWAPAVPA